MKVLNGPSGTLSREVTQRELDHRAIARKIAAEGIVLLENDGVLPLKESSSVGLYGAAARHLITGGTGSGSVNCRPGVSIDDGLRAAGINITSTAWLDALDTAYDKAYEEWKEKIYAMSVPGDFHSLYRSHSANPMQAPAGKPIIREGDTDTAILVISRVSGEGADRHPIKGDYYLSDVEEQQLKELTAAYEKVIVVLNVGGVIDLGFMDRYPIAALVLLSQPGMEGGNALADVLTGKVTPSGHLSETWAMRYEDYPCADTFSHMDGNIIEEKYRGGIYVGYRWFDAFEIKPRYPYGYGKSYTNFSVISPSIRLTDNAIEASFTVTNTGDVLGKEVVFLFAACPDGLRRKERKRLIAYAKTPLLQPGETVTLTLKAGYEFLASYHAGKSAWYLDKGEYRLLFGSNAENVNPLATLTLADTVWGEKQHRICPLLDALPEFQPKSEADARWAEKLNSMFSANLPILSMDKEAQKALDAYSRPADLPVPTDPLIEKMTLEEKARLCCGTPGRSHASFIGDAGLHVPGSAAETTYVLEKYGIPISILADGPAGVRLNQRYETNPENGRIYNLNRYEGLENRIFKKEFYHEGAEEHFQFCTAIPVGMLLAQTFDHEALEEIGGVIAREMEEFGITWWLAPGMNIKRNPLCGRNFEYYSEDPVHSGLIAAALTRGVQSTPGAAVTIKHYACNNQEDNRRGVSSIVSERALREIYLKGFEIAIRQAQPHAIMTSYNKVNGVHTANSYDLCTVATREEWGFKGIIMTDWTTTNSEGGCSAAKCIAAGNDLTMPGLESDIREIMDAVNEDNDQSLNIADLDACCARILTMLRKLC